MTAEQLETYNKRANILYLSFNIDIPLPEEASVLEKCILYMRYKGYCYETIQNKLGSIPKNLIRDTLKKYKPELIKLDTNNHKIPDRLHKLGGDWNWEEFKKGY